MMIHAMQLSLMTTGQAEKGRSGWVGPGATALAITSFKSLAASAAPRPAGRCDALHVKNPGRQCKLKAFCTACAMFDSLMVTRTQHLVGMQISEECRICHMCSFPAGLACLFGNSV